MSMLIMPNYFTCYLYDINIYEHVNMRQKVSRLTKKSQVYGESE